MGIPVLPFCEIEKKSSFSTNKTIPQNLKTIGCHLKKKRLELNLLQKEVSKLLHVTEDAITYWENNRAEPQIHFMPSIIKFLGYIPLDINTSTLGGKILKYRMINGLSLTDMGKRVGVNGSTIGSWEKNINIPQKSSYALLTKTLKDIHKDIVKKKHGTK